MIKVYAYLQEDEILLWSISLKRKEKWELVSYMKCFFKALPSMYLEGRGGAAVKIMVSERLQRTWITLQSHF